MTLGSALSFPLFLTIYLPFSESISVLIRGMWILWAEEGNFDFNHIVEVVEIKCFIV